jgi:hypothetical protein
MLGGQVPPLGIKPPVPLPKGPPDDLGAGRPQSLTPFGAALERALLLVSDRLAAAAPELDALDARHDTSIQSHECDLLQLESCASADVWSSKLDLHHSYGHHWSAELSGVSQS